MEVELCLFVFPFSGYTLLPISTGSLKKCATVGASLDTGTDVSVYDTDAIHETKFYFEIIMTKFS